MGQDKSKFWFLYNPDFSPKPWYIRLWRKFFPKKPRFKPLEWDIKVDVSSEEKDKTVTILNAMEMMKTLPLESVNVPELMKKMKIPKSWIKDKKYFTESRYVPIDENQSSDHDIETLQAPNVASK